MSAFEQLEQEGIFKCRPLTWEVYEAESGAVAVSFSFLVLSELDLTTKEWGSWESFGEYSFFGSWWIVKKDGTINQGAVEQLAKSLGWDGDLGTVNGTPPQKVVQVTVKSATYKDETRFKGSWMNPEDYAGGSSGASSPEAVKGLSARFGSLLRAAAASAAPPAAAPAPAPKPAPAKGPKGPKAAPVAQKGDPVPHNPNPPEDKPCICKDCLPF